MKKIRTGNLSDILQAIWAHEGISRIELSKVLEIDKSTVTNIVSSLVEKDLVEEYEQALSTSLGGRKPVKLRLNKDFGYTIGIEMQSDFTRLVVVNLKGERILDFSGQVHTDCNNFEQRFAEILEELKQRQELVYQQCLGIGLAVSGVVDPFSGIIVDSVALNMSSQLVSLPLSERFGVPIILENDANAACWGEVFLQKNRDLGLKSFLFCLIEFHSPQRWGQSNGASVGLGFVVNGEIHYGEGFSAGEFRSLNWKEGNLSQFSLTPAEMGLLKDTPELRRRFCLELASHLLFLARVFNLNNLFFGGESELLKNELVAAMEEVKARTWPNSPCDYRFSTYGPDSVAFGAACLALTRFFQDPSLA